MIVLYVIGALIAAGAIHMIVQNNRIPRNIGGQDGQLSPMPASPNAVASYAQSEDKKVDPLPLFESAPRTLDLLKQILSEHGAEIISSDERYIHAVYTTPGMKFKDDVEFLILEDKNIVDFRSASRVGQSDMGVNRKRYARIRSRYLELSGNQQQ
ncbi:DUF1499 domain-containing protein [Salinispira pacifica]|uniref:DUF1499 domain-containing protein n=1 Tax=Salinispira pacifica TaxID=1307761 RepID=V5WNA8_9SPIO|nr:DUF1499 domain-containing protein [Salinispira pacifica]AHC16709.1 hypothetical protein L21SP2_3371 [Salinispira pacifica]